jgi:aryl-alcohol dehydrogenase-like predicted oxidoreductase
MTTMTDPTRRTLLAAAASLPLARPALAAEPAMLAKPIPHSGERLPVIGIGTAIVFDYENDPAKQAERMGVIKALADGGGKLIDTAPSYGRAEDRLGEVVQATGARSRLFIATKVAAAQTREQQTASMKESQRRLKTEKFDLMQAWNVRTGDYDLGLLREWKAQGICRYVGITSSFDRDYPALLEVLKREKPDFFQINYSLGDRDAEAMLLPAAREAGCAVLTNGPFGRNSLFARVRGLPLPPFAAEIDATSWPQFFLKYLVSHPTVTAVIPGTDKPEYMLDNLTAGRGRMPDAAMRRRMEDFWASLPG